MKSGFFVAVFMLLLLSSAVVSAQQEEISAGMDENNFISKIDSLFQKFDSLFLFLFSKSYSFSFGMLVVVLLWLVAASLWSVYFYSFFKNSFYAFLLSVPPTIILSWLQIFNLLLKGIETLIELREGPFWSFLVWFFSIVLVALAYQIAKRLLLSWRASRKKKKEHRLRDIVNEGKEFREGLKEGAKL